MLELLGFISYLITLYIYIIIAGAVMSWLIAFNVVNPYNQFVRSLWQALNAAHRAAAAADPAPACPISAASTSRRVVLILICLFIQSVVLIRTWRSCSCDAAALHSAWRAEQDRRARCWRA